MRQRAVHAQREGQDAEKHPPWPLPLGAAATDAARAPQANGTIRFDNSCEKSGRYEGVVGTASPADATYGAAGVFRVRFPGQPPPACPGPNYIVQGAPARAWVRAARPCADLCPRCRATDYTGEVAVVQSANFSTLFILSRKQKLEDGVVDVRAPDAPRREPRAV